ncbi:MAG: hypothetical protein UHO11_11225 [Treponema sp.]|nr:hypothetical protein [Treponema sp.]
MCDTLFSEWREILEVLMLSVVVFIIVVSVVGLTIRYDMKKERYNWQ